jgi:UDP-N-acetylglucosamine 4-epimerase
VQANLLAGCTENVEAMNQIYNIAYGGRTTLNELFDLIRSMVSQSHPEAKDRVPVYKDFRPGDIRQSLANINKAKKLLGYDPQYSVRTGLEKAAKWYIKTQG